MDVEHENIIMKNAESEDEQKNLTVEEYEEVQVTNNDDHSYNTILWPDTATKILITFRGIMHTDFAKKKNKEQKVLLWQRIANKLKFKNFNYTAKHCDEKWRRLLTRFQQAQDASKRSGDGGVKWKYYKLMQDAISPSKDWLHKSSASTTSEITSSFSTLSLSQTKQSSKKINMEKFCEWYNEFQAMTYQPFDAFYAQDPLESERLRRLADEERKSMENNVDKWLEKEKYFHRRDEAFNRLFWDQTE